MEGGFKKTLLVGINYFDDPWKKLVGCINDVNKIDCKFKQLYNGAVDHKILSDFVNGGPNFPSRKNILDGFQWLISDLQKGDSVCFYYCGHGDLSYSPTSNDFHLLTPSEKITHYELRQYLVDKIPAGCKCFVLLDCCHSGNSLDLRYGYDVSGCMTVNEKYSEPDGTVVFFGACRHSEITQDLYGNKYLVQRGGTITNALLDILDKYGKEVKLKTVFQEILSYLKKWGYLQNPEIYSSKPIDYDEILLLL